MSIQEIRKFVESWIGDSTKEVPAIDKPIQICGVTLPAEVVALLKAHYFVECEERANQILQMLEDVERTQLYEMQFDLAERQAETDKIQPKTFNVLELSGQSPHGLLASTMKDEFAAYIRGWSDGAGVHAMRPEFTSHATLAAPYNEGYADGRKARNMAHVAASEKYGVKVSVLRVPEKIGE